VLEIVRREFIFFVFYFEVQLRQIFWYWVFGILFGSAISVFAKNYIHEATEKIGKKVPGIIGIIIASIFGIASPLCMYGTIPICASFSKKGIKDDFLASFMMSSILLNPQLIIYSAALGNRILFIRIFSCFLCGIAAGILIRISKKIFFDFSKFDLPQSKDTDSNIFMRYIKNVGRNIHATGFYFLLGIILSALFARYVPEDLMTKIFAKNEAWGVLMAATIGVPLYVCGGGTVPLLQEWLYNGMSAGSAAAFMITGPATKITNLGALKTLLSLKYFVFYILFVFLFSLLTGVFVNLVY